STDDESVSPASGMLDDIRRGDAFDDAITELRSRAAELRGERLHFALGLADRGAPEFLEIDGRAAVRPANRRNMVAPFHDVHQLDVCVARGEGERRRDRRLRWLAQIGGEENGPEGLHERSA